MSRQVSILRTHIPISRIALFGLIGLLILCTPAALLAISNPPTSYQGAPMNLPVAANSGYFFVDMAVDAAGSVYVLDSANNRIYVESQDYLGLAAASPSGAQGPMNYPGNYTNFITCTGLSPAGFSAPQAITITGGGTLYVADTGHSRVVSVNLITGACSVVGMGTGSTVVLATPRGLAVSEYGDLYISDSTGGPGGHGMIVIIPSINRTGQNAGVAYDIMDQNTAIVGNTQTIFPPFPCNYSYLGTPVVVNGVWNPAHIAWDAYDDILFIADTGNSRILAFGENWVVNGFPAVSTCNIYPATGSGVGPWEIETGGAQWNWPQNFTGGNPNQPYGIAVDSVGNLYWTDIYLSGVYELPHNGPAGSSATWNNTNFFLNTANQSFNGNLVIPNSVYVDQWGTVYVVDTGAGPGPTTNHDRVITNVGAVNGSTGLGAVNFYHMPLNLNRTEWQELAFVVSNGVTVTSATAFTEGTEFLDFNISNTASPNCTSGFMGNGSSYCYVWVSFKPTAPGLRRGTVALYTGTGANGVQIASVPVFGVGAAPEVEFYPTGYGAAISTGSVATIQPMQIALDGNNNLFVADYTGNSVLEVPPQGGTAQVIAAPSGGTATYPEQAAGVALDGSGNVFISDHQGSVIWVAKPLSAYWGFTPLIIDGLGATPLNEPMEINFDPAGNLYIADWGNNRVVEVSGIYVNGDNNFEGRGTIISTNGPYLGQGYNFWNITTNPNSLRSVTGVAVDPLMNVFIADSVAGNIVTAPQSMNQINPGYLIAGRLNWPPSNNGFSGVAGVFKSPQGVASDGMGNLYVADLNSNGLTGRITAGNFQRPFASRWSGFGVIVASNIATSPGPLGNNLFGVAVDPWGNVFVPDYANNRIAAYYPTTPPTLAFGSFYVGSQSPTQTVKLWNIGDEQLTFQAPVTGLNPSISTLTPGTNASFTYGAGSSCTQIGSTGSLWLAGGNGCTILASFVPAYVGSITGNILATDNNLYPAGWTSTTTVWTVPPQTIPLGGTGLMDFTIGVPTPASAVLNPGGVGNFSFTVAPVGSTNFLAPVTFTIVGQPVGSTVTFTPASIATGALSTNVVMTVTAPMIVTSANHPAESLGRKLAPISFALLLLPLLGVRRMRRTWQRYLALLIMLVGGFAATSALTGCSTTPSGYFGQGTIYDYNIIVTANSLGVAHSTTAINITVN